MLLIFIKLDKDSNGEKLHAGMQLFNPNHTFQVHTKNGPNISQKTFWNFYLTFYIFCNCS